MNPLNRSLVSQKIFAVFHSTGTHSALTQLCQDLLEQQKLHWPQLAEGYTALESIRTREILCDGYSVSVQFNPRRIRSTGANLDERAIQERTCFLCLEHLPKPQKGILYCDRFLLLCNPVPIFTRHFTFASLEHIPQDLESSLDVLLDLSRDLRPDYTVFYNGPRSGASAPDHLHFQVIPWRVLPMENDAVNMRRRKGLYYSNHIAGCILMDYGRAVLIVESTDKFRLFEFLKKLLDAWKQLLGVSEEPRMNVLCSYQEELWRLIIVPRRKHRPDIYFSEGADRLLVSPAAVDIGGLIITPLEKDFLRIDAKLIEGIFAEVAEQPEMIKNILEKLR